MKSGITLLLQVDLMFYSTVNTHTTDTIASYEQLGFGAVGTITDKSKFFDDDKVCNQEKT